MEEREEEREREERRGENLIPEYLITRKINKKNKKKFLLKHINEALHFCPRFAGPVLRFLRRGCFRPGKALHVQLGSWRYGEKKRKQTILNKLKKNSLILSHSLSFSLSRTQLERICRNKERKKLHI